MYVMLLLGTIGSALLFGWLLRDFSPGRLVQVIQGAAVATLVLNTVALWRQETRDPQRHARWRERPAREPDFREAWQHFVAQDGSTRRLAAIGLGTLAFGMQDVLIEPYGGQVLGMGVGQTTWLTAALAAGGLCGFGLASVVLGRGREPLRLAWQAALLGMPAFAAIVAAAPAQWLALFAAGVFGVGFAAGLFGHATLTATMNRAPREHTGLALGAWGAVQATAAGVGVALGGILRDVFGALAGQGGLGPALHGPATGYAAVYLLEIVLLLATLVVLRPLLTPPPARPAP
jgi:BCD family chlorophyll transporter-like MFS transporter